MLERFDQRGRAQQRLAVAPETMLAIRRRKSVVSDGLFGGRGTTVADMGDACSQTW
ncbi:hypothetical protein ACQ5SK_47605 [Bradyrhizobium japonicum]